MKIKDLIAQLQAIQDEIGNGGRHGSWAGDVDLMCYGEDTIDDFTIESTEPQTVTGCGCWVGAYIVVKRNGK